MDVSSFYTVDPEFEQKARSPSRETFLHLLINHCLEEDVEYVMRKCDPEQFASEELAPLFSLSDINYTSLEKYSVPSGEDIEDRNYLWAYYMKEIFEIELVPRIAHEVFNLMFADREALRVLNETIAKIVCNLKTSDYPDLLAQDGKIKRCTYWPAWLKNALIYRDKGRCAICLCDLSGLLSTGGDITIDHIVPLNLGGTNDPTNLQILCNKCNLEKSGNSSKSSRYQHVYWNIS